jgi:acetyl esterase
MPTSSLYAWPPEFEAHREEARTMSELSSSVYATQMQGVDADGRLAVMRSFADMQRQCAAGGRDETLVGVRCRIFDPAGANRVGTYLHLHGGGLASGSPEMNDLANDELATRLSIRVVSVDYGLAPERPYPAGADDCLAVMRWVIDDEGGPIAVGGESAGATLSVVTLLRLRDEGMVAKVSAANLVFGAYDLSGTPSHLGSRPSDVPDILDPEGIPALLRAYVPGLSAEAARDPAISPLYADLREMPPALFTVGSADHLLDDSQFMAARWRAFGNYSELAIYPDCNHGFTFAPTELARRAHARIDAFLARAFGKGWAAGSEVGLVLHDPVDGAAVELDQLRSHP